VLFNFPDTLDTAPINPRFQLRDRRGRSILRTDKPTQEPTDGFGCVPPLWL